MAKYTRIGANSTRPTAARQTLNAFIAKTLWRGGEAGAVDEAFKWLTGNLMSIY